MSETSRAEVRVKICGVRSVDMARWVVDAGADYAGLNFVAWSKRCVDLLTAEHIVKALGKVIPVGVFMDHDERAIEAAASALGLEWIQLHGKETPELCAKLSARFKVIKAIAVSAAPPSPSPSLADYAGAGVSAFLFDGPRPGSGRSFLWSETEPALAPRPFFVAGGLTEGNVAEAIRSLRPFGVDTASGAELDGRPDPGRIAGFVRAARSSAR